MPTDLGPVFLQHLHDVVVSALRRHVQGSHEAGETEERSGVTHLIPHKLTATHNDRFIKGTVHPECLFGSLSALP